MNDQDDPKADGELLATLQALQRFGDQLARGAEHHSAGAIAQRVHTTDMVGVVVRD